MSKPLPALSPILFFPFRNSNQVSDAPFSEISSFPVFAFCDLYKYQHKHLPVVSAKEMEANGLNLKEMNLLLLKKVEELTLYLIQDRKVIEELQQENKKQQKEIELLKSK